MNTLLRQITVIFTLLLSFQSYGQDRVMNFRTWHDQQVNAAKNRVVRLLNRITTVRGSTGNIREINKLEIDLRGAVQYVEVVKDMTIEDYFNVYLANRATKRSDLMVLAKTMSKQEVAELLQILLKNRSENLSMDERTDGTARL